MKAEAHNLCVLVVEDEAVIALDIEQTLRDATFDVVACGSSQTALEVIDAHKFACAVVDLKLHGIISLAVVEALEKRAIRFVVASACEEEVLPAPHRDCRFIKKPYARAELLDAVFEATRDRKAS
jgi:DNA-binding NtrC family response regulator